MAEVAVSFVFAQPVGDVWRILRDFGAIGTWLPGAADCAIENGFPPDRIGAIRRFTLNGAIVREQLLALSDLDRGCAYALLQGPLPVRNMIATSYLHTVTETGGTFGTWRASFDVDDRHRQSAIAQLQKLYTDGWSNLKKVLGGAQPVPRPS